MRGPDFFIVGAPKCGTTAMHRYLRQHPEIFMPEAQNQNFFGTDLNFRHAGFSRDFEKYLSWFSEVKYEKRVGETSVWYLYSKRAAFEIKEFCPEAKIIILLRNPVDMLYALHSYFLYNGNEDVFNFAEALKAETARRQGLQIPEHTHFVEGLFYLQTAQFAEQVARYVAAFGRSQIHIILLDDIREDSAKVYRDTLLFLGVAPYFQPDFPVINSNKRIRSKWLRDVILNSKRGEIRDLGRAILPISIRRGLLNRLRHINTQHKPRPALPLDLHLQLQKKLAQDIAALSNLIGRDLSYWSKV